MARRRSKSSKAGGAAFPLIAGATLLIGALGSIESFITENSGVIMVLFILVILGVGAYVIIQNKIRKEREELLNEVLDYLYLNNINSLLKPYDDSVVVKSRQALDNYDDLKYLREHDLFDSVKKTTKLKKEIREDILDFLQQNNYMNEPQYNYVAGYLNQYLPLADGYRVKVTYVTSAGNNLGEKLIVYSPSRVKEIDEHPEDLMTKGEFTKFMKQQEKERLEDRKHKLYDEVNSIINYANESKDLLVVKSGAKRIDDLVQRLFDRTVNSIQKIKQLDSDEWSMLEGFIDSIDKQILDIIREDDKIRQYYESNEFARIQTTCNSLNLSRREFNEYIEEKAQSISKLFGTRVVRNETQNEDAYNYVRAYKKSITPFTAEVSAAVFASAENDPIGYIIKYFYPNKSLYKEQIQNLKILIEELETLKEAKVIIDNYKRDYDIYIRNVPDYVLKQDEDGFYSRLGLAVIDEAVLNVEYKFTYTSGGGKAQRSFTVPMDEETIIELITQLESRLSLQAQTREQRALMTTRLRTYIKERDNYTCRLCGNSIYAEPNLLLEVDHIIPISRGGLTIENNLQTLCWKCNRSKGSKIY